MNGRGAGIRRLAVRVPIQVGVHPGGNMAILVVIEMGVDQRCCQRPSLECNREPDGETAPTHGWILLESFVVDGSVGTELV